MIMADKVTKKTRNRVAVVCNFCKVKKIKCDRQKPCSNCIKYGLGDSCTYASQPAKRGKTYSKRNSSNVSSGTKGKHNSDKSEKSIFDCHIKLQNKNFILMKPSNTQLRPFYFQLHVSKASVMSYKFLVSMKQLFEDERRWWKTNRDKNVRSLESIQLTNLQQVQDHENLNLKLETLITNNYYAILERLTYFQTDLNLILFNSYIPMAVVHSIFHHYISITPVGAIFKRPKKCYEYSFLALIMSLVELTNIFTQPEPARFQFQLVCSPNEFNNISLELLNSSNYLRKCTIFSVYTLLNLRLTLMIYGNSHSAGFNFQNTHPFFVNAVNICIRMGVHVNQSMVEYLPIEKSLIEYEGIFFCKEIPSDSFKKLWNYMLILDATYYIESSLPPAIDDRYCHGYYKILHDKSKDMEHPLCIVQKISLNFAREEASLNILLKNIADLTKVVSTFEPFFNLQELEKNEDKWHDFYLKLKYLKFLLVLLYQTHVVISPDQLKEYFSQEVLQDEKNKQWIKDLRREISIKCKVAYIIGLNIILDISQLNLSKKFVIYVKEIFHSWIGTQTVTFVDLIVNDSIENGKKTSQGDPASILNRPPVFETGELESLLYDFNAKANKKILKHVQDSCEVERIASYLTYVYEAVIGLSVLFSDYNFYITTKIFLFSFYFLFSYLKVHCDLNFSLDSTFDKLKSLTRNIVKKYLKDGKSPGQLIKENITDLIDTEDKSIELKSKENNLETLGNNGTDLTTISFGDIDPSIFQQDDFLSLFCDVDHYVSDIFGESWK